jgi:hypothetical protein
MRHNPFTGTRAAGRALSSVKIGAALVVPQQLEQVEMAHDMAYGLAKRAYKIE